MARDAAYPAVKPACRCAHRPDVAPGLPVGHAGLESASPADLGANHQAPDALPAAVAGRVRPAAGDPDQAAPNARYAAASRPADVPSLPDLRSFAGYRAR